MRLFVFGLLMALLSACGTKGPLVIPPQTKPTSPLLNRMAESVGVATPAANTAKSDDNKGGSPTVQPAGWIPQALPK